MIVIEESTPLEPDAEPSLKRYAPGLGLIFDDDLELAEASPGPQLGIESGVILSWPAVEGDFILEGSSNVDGPWKALDAPLTSLGNFIIASIPSSMDERMFRLLQFHTRPADPFNTALVINEFMPSNSQTIEDPSGGFDDWIELHNTTNERLDLSGMYLSDDTGNLTRWQIPAGTEIDPGGHVLIWADGDVNAEAGLHTNFKIAAGGETLILVGPEGNLDAVIDSVRFDSVEADQSIGRSHSNPAEFSILEPTPGTQNP